MVDPEFIRNEFAKIDNKLDKLFERMSEFSRDYVTRNEAESKILQVTVRVDRLEQQAGNAGWKTLGMVFTACIAGFLSLLVGYLLLVAPHIAPK